jgi:hypothetical protein
MSNETTPKKPRTPKIVRDFCDELEAIIEEHPGAEALLSSHAEGSGITGLDIINRLVATQTDTGVTILSLKDGQDNLHGFAPARPRSIPEDTQPQVPTPPAPPAPPAPSEDDLPRG